MDNEQMRQIEMLMRNIKCSKNFECYKSGFEKLCKVRPVVKDDLWECLEREGHLCEFSHPYGYSYFCRCPLRIYIAKTVEKHN